MYRLASLLLLHTVYSGLIYEKGLLWTTSTKQIIPTYCMGLYSNYKHTHAIHKWSQKKEEVEHCPFWVITGRTIFTRKYTYLGSVAWVLYLLDLYISCN